MPIIGQSARLYQERKRAYVEGTRRGPGPQVYLPDNAVHNIKLEAPLPNPAFAFNPNGPDSALTTVWPNGNQ